MIQATTTSTTTIATCRRGYLTPQSPLWRFAVVSLLVVLSQTANLCRLMEYERSNTGTGTDEALIVPTSSTTVGKEDHHPSFMSSTKSRNRERNLQMQVKVQVPFEQRRHFSMIPNQVHTDPIVVSAIGEPWERTFYRANMTLVGRRGKRRLKAGGRKIGVEDLCPNPAEHHRALPLFRDGVAAGPRICYPNNTSPKSNHSNNNSNSNNSNHKTAQQQQQEAEEECQSHHYLDLYAIKMLQQGTAMRIEMPDKEEQLQLRQTLVERWRQAAVSSVVFLDHEHFAGASFQYKEFYIFWFNMTTKETQLVLTVQSDIVVEPIAYDGKDMLVVGNFMEAKQTLYQITSRNPWQIKQVKRTHAFAGSDQFCHTVEFYPHNNQIIATASQKMPQPESIAMKFWDWKNDRALATWNSFGTVYEGLKFQQVSWVEDQYNLLVMFHGAVIGTDVGDPCPPYTERQPPFSYLVHFRFPYNLEEALHDKTVHYNNSHFKIIQSLTLDFAVVENLAYRDGIVLISDQWDDKVIAVHFDVTATSPMHVITTFTGYHMPHGLGISSFDDNVMGVSTYGDNSVIIHEMYPEIRDLMKQHSKQREQ